MSTDGIVRLSAAQKYGLKYLLGVRDELFAEIIAANAKPVGTNVEILDVENGVVRLTEPAAPPKE